MTATAPRPSRRRGLLATLAATALALTGLASAGSASAAVQWSSEAYQAPTNLSPGGQGMVRLFVSNLGDTSSSGHPTVSFELPPGVTLSSVSTNDFWLNCTGSGTPQTVTCTSLLAAFPVGPERYIGPPGTPQKSQVQAVVDVSPAAPEAAYKELEVVVSNSDDTTTDTYELTVSSDQLGFGPTPGSFTAGAFDDAGAEAGRLDDADAPYTQAGGHPYQASASFKLNTRFREPENTTSDYNRAIVGVESIKDVVVDLPAGFTGDPSAVPACEGLGAVKAFTCPAATQVGVAEIAPAMQGFDGRQRMVAVYNVRPPANSPAQFAFQAPVGTVVLEPILRSDGDLGLSVQVRNVTQADDSASILARTTLWGQAAHSSHDAQRCARLNGVTKTCTGTDESGEPPSGKLPSDVSTPHTSSAPHRPFLTSPTRCNGQPDVTRLHVASWENPGAFEPDGDPDLSDPNWKSASAESPPLTGCDKLQFNPTLKSEPTETDASSPSGLDFELGVPQNDAVNGLATAHLKDTTVALPEGMSVNPSSANGLEACSPDEIGLTSPVGNGDPVFDKADPDCPLASKIGEVEVDTPLLDDPLSGDVFLASQDDNPFGSMIAIYLAIEGPGLIVKLAGEVEADPDTGQLTTTVTENPQLPFDKLTLSLKSGARAPLATPATCGSHSTEARFTSWAGHDVERSDAFRVGEGCSSSRGSRPFDIGMQTGSMSPFAGSHTPFVLRLTRPDGAQEFDRVELKTPEGFAATLRGVPYCPESGIAQAASRTDAGDGELEKSSPACPAASQVGTTTIGVGVGPEPYYASGKAYLAGPYKGAPLSMVFVVPAVAGPFDLGVQVVRAALNVDPSTAQITATSDPLPKILQGIPLKIKDIRVNIDKPRFALNPTDCSPQQVQGTIRGSNGATTELSNRFQVGGCGDLGFKPRLKLQLFGGVKRASYQALRAVVRPRPGDANIGRTVVRMPRSAFLAQEHLKNICTRVQWAADACPKNSIYGRAIAWSPLLDHPLRGNVHLRSSDNLLPDLVADLRGPAHQPIRIELVGRTDSVKGALRNTFDVVPDAPVSYFRLQLFGKQKGLIVNSRNICRGTNRAGVRMDAQNGRRHITRPVVRNRRCAKLRRAKRKARRSAHQAKRQTKISAARGAAKR